MRSILAALCVLLLCGCAGSAPAPAPGVDAQRASIEAKYGIEIRGNVPLDADSLTTLDQALENMTPELVRALSAWFQEKTGRPISYDYEWARSGAPGAEAVLAGFDKNSARIRVFVPEGSGAILTGENPISLVHELGHALQIYYTSSYGAEQMREEWAALNGDFAYAEEYLAYNPDPMRFASGYAATMYEEDVAETIGHAFIRCGPGQGFGGHLDGEDGPSILRRKLEYVEGMLDALGFADACANFRRCYEADASAYYEGMHLTGDYLQYSGYPAPKHVLRGILDSLGINETGSEWLPQLGGWRVAGGSEDYLIFPGGTWCVLPPE